MFLPLKTFAGRAQRRKSTVEPTRHSREVDRILDKISTQGLHSLTEAERNFLQGMSQKLQNRASSNGRESDLVI
jgi:hypothetical protein